MSRGLDTQQGMDIPIQFWKLGLGKCPKIMWVKKCKEIYNFFKIVHCIYLILQARKWA